MTATKKTKSHSSRLKKLSSFFKKRPAMSWFDMGLLLDAISDKREKNENLAKSFPSFMKSLSKGVAFTTCEYGVDGVSVEIAKYARVMENLSDQHTGKPAKIHLISGEHKRGFESILKPDWHVKLIDNAGGFSDWDAYETYFHTKLSRGSKEYNDLAENIWEKTTQIALDLGKYITENDIQLLFVVNSASNPGNLSLTFAIVLISEIMQIPVYNSCHDFYWEQGKPKWKRAEGEPAGIRDHFFTNADIGEVFSLIEMLCPWNSPLWFHSAINMRQLEALSVQQGFCPNTVGEIGTAVDLGEFKPRTEIDRYATLKRLKKVLMQGSDEVGFMPCKEYLAKLEDNPSPDLKTTPIVLGAEEHLEFNLNFANLLFVQPTRIIKRKRIARNFALLKELLSFPLFKDFIDAHPHLCITILVTGPVASGQDEYFKSVVEKFNAMLDSLEESIQKRVFLTFCFGNDRYKSENEKGFVENKIYELFSIANLVMLPSDQEGRGLPIIEAAATGVSTLCRRYSPEEVFDQVIGKHLDEKQRLRINTFSGDEFPPALLEQVTKSIIEPGDCLEDRAHNRAVIKTRYSYKFLSKQIEDHLRRLWNKAKPENSPFALVERCFNQFEKATVFDQDFKNITLSEHRKYLPGISQIEYMSYLKSLIDPSFFRIEERELRGRITSFVERLISSYETTKKLSNEKREQIFHNIEKLYKYNSGNHKLAIDHSLCYRHRNRVRFPYRSYTEVELRGIAALVFRSVVGGKYKTKIPVQTSGMFHNRKTLLLFLANNQSLGIDDSDLLIKRLDEGKPIAWFTGSNIALEARLLAIGVMKNRFGKSLLEQIDSDDFKSDNSPDVSPLTLFVRETPLRKGITYDAAIDWLENSASENLKFFYKSGLLKVVKTTQLSAGNHLGQIGKKAKKEIKAIQEAGGFAVSFNDHNMFALDLLNMPSFRIGVSYSRLTSYYLGIKEDEGYVQYLPTGVRSSLAYPTPVQTPKEYSLVQKSDDYKRWVERDGIEKVEQIQTDDANEKGTPLSTLINDHFTHSDSSENSSSSIISSKITGLHKDGAPFSGAKVFVKLSELQKENTPMHFSTESSTEKGQTVMDLATAYEKKHGKKVSVSWNGGYILNPELVGKLGLPEKYIGTPLGLLIANGKLISPPLFNKPALTFLKNGALEIRRANLSNGLTLSAKNGASLSIKGEDVNNSKSKNAIVYDLMFKEKALPKKDRVLYRIAGSHIIEVIKNSEPTAEILPVGLVVSTSKPLDGWEAGTNLEFSINGWEEVENAVEAGPLLVSDSKIAIDMKEGGWTTANSIATQAARIDYTDMRGPKIGTGIDSDGNLIVVVINGRIRESVGATHEDLAKIFQNLGAKIAMGFDPGGSSTLVVDGEQMNISPYNKDYESNIYTLPPEPRFIGNAVLGVVETSK